MLTEVAKDGIESLRNRKPSVLVQASCLSNPLFATAGCSRLQSWDERVSLGPVFVTYFKYAAGFPHQCVFDTAIALADREDSQPLLKLEFWEAI